MKFDVCIIDEASQALEPVVLGPILLANKFILIGDHYQLQPLVKSKEALEKGMGKSLFERLVETHQSSVSKLRYQVRLAISLLTFQVPYERRYHVFIKYSDI